MDIKDVRINQKVSLRPGMRSAVNVKCITGRVCGTATEIREDGEIMSLVLVRLDNGFFVPGPAPGFVSILPAHPDHITVV